VWQSEQEAREQRTAWARARRAEAFAMLGRSDEARAILSELRAELIDYGSVITLAELDSEVSVDIELLAGNPAAAVEFGEGAFQLLDEVGKTSGQSIAMLAEALYANGRLDEAQAWAERAEDSVGATIL
jgi:hypothetical protein